MSTISCSFFTSFVCDIKLEELASLFSPDLNIHCSYTVIWPARLSTWRMFILNPHYTGHWNIHWLNIVRIYQFLHSWLICVSSNSWKTFFKFTVYFDIYINSNLIKVELFYYWSTNWFAAFTSVNTPMLQKWLQWLQRVFRPFTLSHNLLCWRVNC